MVVSRRQQHGDVADADLWPRPFPRRSTGERDRCRPHGDHAVVTCLDACRRRRTRRWWAAAGHDAEGGRRVNERKIAIRLEELTRVFDTRVAVDHVNLEIYEGEF